MEGFLSDCEIFVNIHLTFVWSSSLQLIALLGPGQRSPCSPADLSPPPLCCPRCRPPPKCVLCDVFDVRDHPSITSSRGVTNWSGWEWVVKQIMMWWWYFVEKLYSNIIKLSKYPQRQKPMFCSFKIFCIWFLCFDFSFWPYHRQQTSQRFLTVKISYSCLLKMMND